MHLLHYLQKTQHLSRRKIVELIKEGQIFVNNQKVESIKHPLKLWDTIFKNNDRLLIVETIPNTQTKIVLFNKPKGFVVSKSDPHNATIYEILPSELKTYYYIGRLDKESKGLLLLTNAPEIVHYYEHPKFNIQKEYLVQLSHTMNFQDRQQTKRWITDDGEVLKFLEISPTNVPFQYKILLNEGKKRHIRRIMKSLGYEVVDLQRIREGEFILWDIPEGKRKISTLSSSFPWNEKPE